jgi:signal transduction histidine kinase
MTGCFLIFRGVRAEASEKGKKGCGMSRFCRVLTVIQIQLPPLVLNRPSAPSSNPVLRRPAPSIDRELELLRAEHESLRRSVRRVGHDLANVLTATMGAVELLLQDHPQVSETHTLLKLIETSTKRGSHLSLRLLDLAPKVGSRGGSTS